jgi:GntR family transcriptional regulator
VRAEDRTWFRPDRYSRRRREETGQSPFRIAVANQGGTPATESRSVSLAEAPDDIARRLGLRRGTEVVHRENRYFVDGEPVQYGVTYIPATIAADSSLATATDLGPGSIYARLEELGWPVALIREEVSARLPTPDEAESLAIPPGVPVIEMIHTSMDDWKRPFEVTRFVMRADRLALDYEVPIDD